MSFKEIIYNAHKVKVEIQSEYTVDNLQTAIDFLERIKKFKAEKKDE